MMVFGGRKVKREPRLKIRFGKSVIICWRVGERELRVDLRILGVILA